VPGSQGNELAGSSESPFSAKSNHPNANNAQLLFGKIKKLWRKSASGAAFLNSVSKIIRDTHYSQCKPVLCNPNKEERGQAEFSQCQRFTVHLEDL
jgi:hypothetical protein